METIAGMMPTWMLWSCCGLTPGDAQKASDEGEAQRLEAMMIAARNVCDRDGYKVHHPAPPAVMLALLRIARADDPMHEVSEMMRAERARTEVGNAKQL